MQKRHIILLAEFYNQEDCHKTKLASKFKHNHICTTILATKDRVKL